VLVDHHQPDGAQVKLADPGGDCFRRGGLLVGVQAMPGDEAALADAVDQVRAAAADLAAWDASRVPPSDQFC
jgi:hypothetical protein